MNTESYRGKSVTVKSTGEKGIIQALTHRRSGIGALSARFIVKINDSDIVYECMPHEVTINPIEPGWGQEIRESSGMQLKLVDGKWINVYGQEGGSRG